MTLTVETTSSMLTFLWFLLTNSTSWRVVQFSICCSRTLYRVLLMIYGWLDHQITQNCKAARNVLGLTPWRKAAQQPWFWQHQIKHSKAYLLTNISVTGFISRVIFPLFLLKWCLFSLFLKYSQALPLRYVLTPEPVKRMLHRNSIWKVWLHLMFSQLYHKINSILIVP